ncbi:hypothetical protein M9H77_09620 [Catharanthus roseus]|uniref:Uncharacterized protein n=1 Tax=Catharanthus roseus TaxID=4058 RepID=A0ACC0C194_CATRO|nr:hypothetical protein M9H77_09620 [Catharanthus roseus]
MVGREKIEKCRMGMSIPRLYPGPWRVGSGSRNFIPGRYGSGSVSKFHYKGLDFSFFFFLGRRISECRSSSSSSKTPVRKLEACKNELVVNERKSSSMGFYQKQSSSVRNRVSSGRKIDELQRAPFFCETSCNEDDLQGSVKGSRSFHREPKKNVPQKMGQAASCTKKITLSPSLSHILLVQKILQMYSNLHQSITLKYSKKKINNTSYIIKKL